MHQIWGPACSVSCLRVIPPPERKVQEAFQESSVVGVRFWMRCRSGVCADGHAVLRPKVLLGGNSCVISSVATVCVQRELVGKGTVVLAATYPRMGTDV